MATTMRKENESEVNVGPSGKRLTYDGAKWVRKDVYDRVSEHVVLLYADIERLENEVYELKCRLDEESLREFYEGVSE